MAFTETLIQSILTLVGLISLGMFLRRVGVLKQEHGGLFAKLITNVTLPALIFNSLSTHPVGWEQVLLAVVMIIAEVACLVLAWVIGGLLKLSRPQKGAFILVSGFGSSAFLGFALVKEVFTDNAAALSEAVVISELGVGSLIFTVGVILAMYFGSGSIKVKDQLGVTLKFFRSPIFISMLSGLLYPFLPISSDNFIISTIYKILDVLGNANTVLVAFTIGILLRFQNFRSVLPVAIAACVIKLILQPVLVLLPSGWMDIPLLWRKVLVLEAAMPSSTLAAVFSSRYGCDSRLASVIVFTATICSIVTVVGLFFVMG